MNGDGGFDWGSAIMVGNEIGQQWYALVTGKTLPTQEGATIGPGGVRVTAGTNTTIIVVAALALAAVLLWKK